MTPPLARSLQNSKCFLVFPVCSVEPVSPTGVEGGTKSASLLQRCPFELLIKERTMNEDLWFGIFNDTYAEHPALHS